MIETFIPRDEPSMSLRCMECQLFILSYTNYRNNFFVLYEALLLTTVIPRTYTG